MSDKKETYREAIEEIDRIVTDIESENIDVDVLIEKAKRAAYLIKLCKSKLKATEDEVKGVLSELEQDDAQGNEPF